MASPGPLPLWARIRSIHDAIGTTVLYGFSNLGKPALSFHGRAASSEKSAEGEKHASEITI